MSAKTQTLHCLNLLLQEILESNGIGRKLPDPFGKFLHRHLILIEVEPTR
jgi:hypothetical protein